jgi:hypothetical protein
MFTATTVSGLANARAVSIASDGPNSSDGPNNIAIVAELGCSPQTIALALGTLTGSGPRPTWQVITVAPAGASFAVQPTVAWVPAADPLPAFWLVSWLSGTPGGGAHVLAQRYDSSGNPLGGLIDPGVRGALAAMASENGNLFVYEQTGTGGSLLDVAIGCP